jgi:transcriptional regulator with XRE-family HTH domain
MSLSPTDQIVVDRQTQNAFVRKRLAEAFKKAVAYSPSPAKELAIRLGITSNGAALLLRGEVAPRADTLTLACREFDEVWKEMRSLSDRPPERAERILEELAEKLHERRSG